jgi:hypothetical protein
MAMNDSNLMTTLQTKSKWAEPFFYVLTVAMTDEILCDL